MATSDRRSGLGRGMARAGAELYWNIRQEGHANVREWWNAVLGPSPAHTAKVRHLALGKCHRPPRGGGIGAGPRSPRARARHR